MAVLAGEVQRREAAGVARAQVRARCGEQRHAAAVALPRCLMRCCVAVLGNRYVNCKQTDIQNGGYGWEMQKNFRLSLHKVARRALLSVNQWPISKPASAIFFNCLT